MLNLPTPQEIEQLHDKYASSELSRDLVFTHSKIIAEIALDINEKKALGLDPKFLEVAAMIHDIGAYTYISADGAFDKANYILHGITGYKILQQEGYPEFLCRIASRHTGVGFTIDEIKSEDIPLPMEDFMAETLEEKVIMYADKFHSKDPCFNSFAWYSAYIEQFGQQKRKRFEEMAELFGIPDIKKLARKYSMPINI